MASYPQAPLPHREPKIVFIGPTGSGKTTLINDLLGLKSDAGQTYPGGQPRPRPLDVSAGANSMTSQTSVVRGQLTDGTPCTCIDTPGLNDTANNDSENIVNMVRTLKEQVREVHTFVIVLNGQNPRLDQAHKDMISIFGKCFGSDFMQNMVLAFTRWHNDDVSMERRVDEMCSDGFQGSPEQYREAEFARVFQDAFHFTGQILTIFGDFKLRTTASSHEKGENARAKRDLAVYGRTMTPFPCQNIKAAKTFLDAARGELKEVQQANDELSAQYKEQKRVHLEEMSKIRKDMDASKADHAGKLRLLEEKVRNAEARAAEASREGGGGSEMMGLIAAMMMMSLQQQRGGGGGGGGGGAMMPPMMPPMDMGGMGGAPMSRPQAQARPSATHGGRRCKDGSLNMTCKENFGKSKYG